MSTAEERVAYLGAKISELRICLNELEKRAEILEDLAVKSFGRDTGLNRRVMGLERMMDLGEWVILHRPRAEYNVAPACSDEPDNEDWAEEWQAGIPTEPGWYWIYTLSMRKSRPEIMCVKVVITDGVIEFVIPCGGYECENDIEPCRTTHFKGPVKAPLPPQE